jgi:DNA-binding HxlR family transcriptional regulator
MYDKRILEQCPVHQFQHLIAGKYKLRIIWDLADGPKRYSELRRGLLRGVVGTQEIAPRVLSRELKALTAAGVLERIDYRQLPLKVEYELTALGESLLPVIATMHRWGEQHFT